MNSTPNPDPKPVTRPEDIARAINSPAPGSLADRVQKADAAAYRNAAHRMMSDAMSRPPVSRGCNCILARADAYTRLCRKQSDGSYKHDPECCYNQTETPSDSEREASRRGVMPAPDSAGRKTGASDRGSPDTAATKASAGHGVQPRAGGGGDASGSSSAALPSPTDTGDAIGLPSKSEIMDSIAEGFGELSDWVRAERAKGGIAVPLAHMTEPSAITTRLLARRFVASVHLSFYDGPSRDPKGDFACTIVAAPWPLRSREVRCVGKSFGLAAEAALARFSHEVASIEDRPEPHLDDVDADDDAE